MVDRAARDSAASALRDFVNGSISNKEYERRYPRSKSDPAILEIYVQAWFFCSDVREHTLTGKHVLTDENRTFFERCILFLRSDSEFQWPPTKISLWYPLLRLIGLGRVVNRKIEEAMSVGDKEVWPFLKKADYDMTRVRTGDQYEPYW